MKLYKLNLILVILVYSVNSYGQNNKNSIFCQEELLGKSFISDGQDHQVLLKSAKTTKFNIVFYPKFRYKLVICSNNKLLPIEFKLLDNSGTIYFSNVDKKYVREWEFQYSSIINAIVELKLIDNKVKEENIRLLIGYQPL